jgi:hypothetical protein
MVAPVFELADEIQHACQYCATIGRANLQRFFERGLVPRHTDATATVTFIRLERQTYAVTAGHVITTFDRQSAQENAGLEPYSVPAGEGALIQPPFIRPPAIYPHPAPDLAIAPISTEILARVGKVAFELHPQPQPKYPVPYAVAVGFPTLAKVERNEAAGTRIAMPCVHAVAHGLGGPEHADQIQFFSDEIERNPEIISLSGMSGGPVFWSDANQFGLLGFVKEALDVAPVASEGYIWGSPRVSFITQHAPYEKLLTWAEYARQRWPEQRALLNAASQLDSQDMA